MTAFRVPAGSLPDIRDQIRRSWGPDGIGSRFETELRAMPPEERPAVGEIPTSHFQLWSLSDCELWSVRPEAGDMIAQAAPSIPDDSSLADDMRPIGQGPGLLIAFEEGIECTTWVDGSNPAPLQVMLATFFRISDHPGPLEHVNITWYYPVGDEFPAEFQGQWMVLVSSTWDIATAVSEPSRVASNGLSGSDIEDRRLLLATLALVDQERIIESRVHLDRPTRRRAERAGRDAALDAVRICDLRRSVRDARVAAEAQEGRYRHRWVVDGHWRSQPYGPKRSLRKPTWIAPHLKGPEGAPLLSGEKVKVVRPDRLHRHEGPDPS